MENQFYKPDYLLLRSYPSKIEFMNKIKKIKVRNVKS